MTIHISASLLAADFARLGDAVIQADKAGVDAFHFDMMDGHYVPNIAFSPQHLLSLRKYTTLPFQLHLELSNPDHVLDEFHDLEAQMILVQWDTLADPEKTFKKIKKRGATVGLSLNPNTEISSIMNHLEQVDMLLLLSVNPGFGGQSMVPGIPERIRELKDILATEKPGLPIAVDGGVNLNNAKMLISEGINWLIIGSALYNNGNMAGFVDALKNI